MNSTLNSAGRFGNHFFRNIYASFIAKKNNLKFNYSYKNYFDKLGIELYNGINIYEKTLLINDKNFYQYLFDNNNDYNIQFEEMYAQTKDFSLYLFNYCNEINFKNNIINNNIFKDRYNNNDDVFIHIRIGDLCDRLDIFIGYEYYNKTLEKIPFKTGYISSDSINHEICKKLIEKYNLIIINYDEIEIIMFGSTCKNIILSHGTYSWLIGILGYYSNIFYLDPTEKTIWHGDIFVYNHWNKIKLL
jgi:hypothetical protein